MTTLLNNTKYALAGELDLIIATVPAVRKGDAMSKHHMPQMVTMYSRAMLLASLIKNSTEGADKEQARKIAQAIDAASSYMMGDQPGYAQMKRDRRAMSHLETLAAELPRSPT